MSVFDFFVVFFARYLGYFLVGILVIFFFRDTKRYLSLFWQIIFAVIISRVIITELIRFFWQRPRPFVEQNITPLIAHAPSPSFPSAHAAFFFAIASVIFFYNKKLGLLFFVGALLISIARVLAHLHWVSDIIAGAIIGIASGFFVFRLWQWKMQKIRGRG